MKRLILTFVVILSGVLTTYAQRAYHLWDVYTDIDSLIIENVQGGFGEGNDYIINLPKSGKIIIAYNKDHDKAIVLKMNTPRFVRHKEYNVKDDETRTVLFYKDEHIYCGYIYDKRIKAGKYFEAINSEEKDKLVEKLPFLKRLPTFVK